MLVNVVEGAWDLHVAWRALEGRKPGLIQEVTLQTYSGRNGNGDEFELWDEKVWREKKERIEHTTSDPQAREDAMRALWKLKEKSHTIDYAKLRPHLGSNSCMYLRLQAKADGWPNVELYRVKGPYELPTRLWWPRSRLKALKLKWKLRRRWLRLRGTIRNFVGGR